MREYIGVLDSGVGGLSVLAELTKLMPDANYIYLGDTKNMPYGTKTPKEIFTFTKAILEFFIKKNVKNVVFACNTTSAVAYEELKKEFQNKLRIFPLIQTAAPYIVKETEGKDIAVLATKATINSKKYNEEIAKINPKLNVHGIDCTGLVEIVENRLYDDSDSIELIKSKLDIVKKTGAKRVVLGCTHYPYLIDIFKKILPDVEYFNPARCISEVVKKEVNIQSKNSEIQFWATKNPEEFKLSAETFFKIKDEVRLVELF